MIYDLGSPAIMAVVLFASSTAVEYCKVIACRAHDTKLRKTMRNNFRSCVE